MKIFNSSVVDADVVVVVVVGCCSLDDGPGNRK
jgi:hypothetical protein